MVNTVLESYYPKTFRKEISQNLGYYLKNRQTIIMIGMRRVGISNFLRFFLSHKKVIDKHIPNRKKHLFIHVDLNDLVEREVFPFWMLTLKRIVDNCERLNLEPKIKKYVENLFLDSIQSKDLFLLFDCVRLSLIKITQAGFIPTMFLIHFDRIKDAVTPELFANLESLYDATNHQLTYVLTSFRSLDQLAPKAFSQASPALIVYQMYVKTAEPKDLETIYKVNTRKYNLHLPKKFKEELFAFSGGYIQYLLLALITLSEKIKILNKNFELFPALIEDERIALQSEELWDSLNETEQDTLIQIVSKEKISKDGQLSSKYLWDTGLVATEKGKTRIFSPIFENFIKSRQTNGAKPLEMPPLELSKKEHLLFTCLQNNLNQICEREAIIEAVWPEEEELGVSDWAIDRLVARVRSKLKQQNSSYEIVTVKTRGYKLI
ncbi:helix-turn-helix domain-containing protein [Candidatus Daviesbacteria bacterium]|nr:helix-turn-helix domain-containing protein [Candidatus Daviesbacteria bacterium]